MTPADHLKYHQLFVQYDTNKDGFLSEPEAVGVLSKSGVPVDLLQAVYTMADVDKDTRLSSKEFCVAFHLILCVT
jgi:Ca2+-binding EF-hand superfamily protein